MLDNACFNVIRSTYTVLWSVAIKPSRPRVFLGLGFDEDKSYEIL